MKHPCACCGNYTLNDGTTNSYEVCPVCFWENDTLQNTNENLLGCANSISLKKAKTNYHRFGAMKESYIPYVRKPLQTEIPYSHDSKNARN